MSSNVSTTQTSSSPNSRQSNDVSQKTEHSRQLLWSPVLSLRQTKRQLQVLYHRESRQARILQILSDQTAFWALAGTLPFILYLRNEQFPGRVSTFLDVQQKALLPSQIPSVLGELSSSLEKTQPRFAKLQSRFRGQKTPNLNYLFESYPLEKDLVGEQNKNLSLKPGLTWSQTNQIVSVYQKIELGKSPRRNNRFESTQSPLQNRGNRRRQKGQTGSRSTRVPSLARLFVETSSPSVGIENAIDRKVSSLENSPTSRVLTRARWQEKRVALLQQRIRQREQLELRVSKGLKRSTNTVEDIENVSAIPSLPITGETLSGTKPLLERPPIERWVSVPYQTVEQLKVGGETTEHLVGSRQGPTFIPRASNILRRSFYLTQRRFDREDAARLLQLGSFQEKGGETSGTAPQLARYAVRSERQQETAEERLGIAQWAARSARRYRDGNLTADRPYRAVRVGHFQFGRRSHPGYAARRRLYRRRTRNALRVQSLVAKRGGFPRGRLVSSSFTCRFPEREWTRYVRGQDLRLAQAQRRWWRAWHRQDPGLYGELRRAGRRFRERAGRKNLGWWRSLVARPRDSVFRRNSKGSIPAKPRQDVLKQTDFLSPSASKRFLPRNTSQNWFEQRAVPLGWASRLKDPNSLQQVLARDLAGRPDAKLPFWITFPARTPDQRFQTPFTLAILYLSWQIRTKAYNSVQADFLRAREALLRRGGVRERDPEWRSWLLEALGISRTSAGIRQYPPGDRTLARHLAGLRRDLPRWRERLSYLRYNRYSKREALFLGKKQAAPRPTLLVGAPGTGKTSLVRILADEAGVPVIYQCLAAFTDAGARFTAFGFGRTVAPQAVQRGFDEARRATPSILFLDEIDALGATRTSPEGKQSTEGELSEKNNRASGDQRLGLGQLLVEIDAGRKNSGLVLFAATNRPEGLDPALVRPGRLDRTVSVPLPNRSKRRSILKLYAGRFGSLAFGKTSGSTVNVAGKNGASLEGISWQTWATRTRGLSAAHLASLRNTACLVSVLAEKQTLTSKEVGSSSLFESSLEVALKRLQSGSSALERNPNSTSERIGKNTQQKYSIAAQKVVNDVLVTKVPGGVRSSILTVDLTSGTDWIPHSTNGLPTEGQLFQRRLDRWRQLCWYRAGRAGETRCRLTGFAQVEELTASFSYLQAASRLSRTIASENLEQFSTLPSRNFFQAEEFKSDPKLLQYLLDFGLGVNYEKPLAPVYQEAKESLDWPAEWYGFEIPEVPGFRSVGWIPPELHKSGTLPVHQTNVELERQILFKSWNETLWVLLKNRVQLDLAVAKLQNSNSPYCTRIL